MIKRTWATTVLIEMDKNGESEHHVTHIVPDGLDLESLPMPLDDDGDMIPFFVYSDTWIYIPSMYHSQIPGCMSIARNPDNAKPFVHHYG